MGQQIKLMEMMSLPGHLIHPTSETGNYGHHTCNIQVGKIGNYFF